MDAPLLPADESLHDPGAEPLRRGRQTPRRRPEPVDFSGDQVVLLDAAGRPSGAADKASVHGPATPLHLACSCYVVDVDGRVLLTRRARSKRTFPGVWTNSCCGHPRPHEHTDEAVRRHLAGELGLEPAGLRCVLPDFAYRATDERGTMEHELCPVYVAQVTGRPVPNPREVEAHEWVEWAELVDRARERPESLSPWSVDQVLRLARRTTDLRELVAADPGERPARALYEVVDPFGLGGPVEDELAAFLDDRRVEAVGLAGAAGELVDAVRGLVEAGGKRVRPAFVCWGFRAAGHDDAGPALGAAASIEMLHTFALVHDDVMDASPRRRGRDAVHVELAGLPASSRWTDTTRRRFGDAGAILAGDLAFAWAHQLLDRAVDAAPHPERVRSVFATLCNEVVVGQYLDVRLTNSPCSEEQAATIALLKSGRYTVTRPLELGAALGGGDTATIDQLREYGDATGVAFQLRDDVLGVFGDDATTGKGCSDDLRDGKASLLLVRAMALATPAGRHVLDRHLGDPEMDDDAAERCRDVVRESGALASVERLIEAKCDVAHRAAGRFDPPVSGALHQLASAMAERAA